MSVVELFAMVPIGQLRESALNPRKHFDPRKLEELAGSIDERGVITPLVVRQVPSKSTAKPRYEIAAGHRRYRAARLLERAIELPCRILDLDDGDFLEIVTIENLQREDIHPLEEADGFKALISTGKYREPDFENEEVRNLADKIGKSEAYVRGRLELCDLVEPARQSFLTDSITIGHARLISRVAPDKQEEALRSCFEQALRSEQPELISLREFKRRLKQDQGADLAKAPFDIEDASLKSDAGACTTCPRCTGTQRSLLADDTAEQLCLDRSCYSQKVNAHVMRLTAKGLISISKAYSGDIPAGVASAHEYVEAQPDQERIDELRQDLAQDVEEGDGDAQYRKQLEEELAEVEAKTGECDFMEEAVIVHGYHGDGEMGRTMKICRSPECPKHGKEISQATGRGGGDRGKDPKAAAAEEKRKRDRKLDQAVRRRAWETLIAAVELHGQSNERVLYLAATGFFYTADREFCKAFGIEAEKGDWQPAKKWAANATEAQLVKFIVAAAFDSVGLSEYFDKTHSGKDEWQQFRDTLAKYEVSYSDIEKDVREDFKAAETKKKAKGAAKQAKAGKGK